MTLGSSTPLGEEGVLVLMRPDRNLSRGLGQEGSMSLGFTLSWEPRKKAPEIMAKKCPCFICFLLMKPKLWDVTGTHGQLTYPRP